LAHSMAMRDTRLSDCNRSTAESGGSSSFFFFSFGGGMVML
jgi:hypothetical protein